MKYIEHNQYFSIKVFSNTIIHDINSTNLFLTRIEHLKKFLYEKIIRNRNNGFFEGFFYGVLT